MAQRVEIPALTGLRGIAALMVVLAHYQVVAPYTWHTGPLWMVTLFGAADYGMTLFFTLSGFVIVYNYFDFPWAEKPIQAMARFAWLRFSRLYPLLFLFLIIHTNWTKFDLWTALHYFAVETWVPLKQDGVLPISGIFNLSWSISTEFGLYVGFALVMMIGAPLWKRGRLIYLLIPVAVYILAVLAMVFSPQFLSFVGSRIPTLMEPFTADEQTIWLLYESPYYRLIEFGIGGMAAWAVIKQPRWLQAPAMNLLPIAAVIGLVVMHWRWFLGGPWWVDRWTLEATSSLLFAAIMMTSTRANAVSRFLACRPLIFLGEISYSLYLFHLTGPAIAAAYGTAGAFTWSGFMLYLGRLALTLLAGIALAAGLYRIVERPAQRALRSIWPQGQPWPLLWHRPPPSRELPASVLPAERSPECFESAGEHSSQPADHPVPLSLPPTTQHRAPHRLGPVVAVRMPGQSSS